MSASFTPPALPRPRQDLGLDHDLARGVGRVGQEPDRGRPRLALGVRATSQGGTASPWAMSSDLASASWIFTRIARPPRAGDGEDPIIARARAASADRWSRSPHADRPDMATPAVARRRQIRWRWADPGLSWGSPSRCRASRPRGTGSLALVRSMVMVKVPSSAPALAGRGDRLGDHEAAVLGDPDLGGPAAIRQAEHARQAGRVLAPVVGGLDPVLGLVAHGGQAAHRREARPAGSRACRRTSPTPCPRRAWPSTGRRRGSRSSCRRRAGSPSPPGWRRPRWWSS